MCEFLPPCTTGILFDVDAGDAVQRLVGLNRSKSEEWREYPFVISGAG
jgi:hypothetical protein